MPITDHELNVLTDQAVSLLIDLIKIPAFSKDESARATYLYDYLLSQKLFPKRVENNIILKGNHDPVKKKVLLNSHIDTVKPVGGWVYNPHEPVLRDGKLTGLGANDAGASVVSLLAAYQYLSKQSLTYELIYAASAEEEISGHHGIVEVINEIGRVDLAIVGEPTGMNMAIAEKGLMVLDGLAKGKSGHAAREEGINALYVAIEDIQKIKSFAFDKVSSLLGKTQASVTMIHAGTQHNVVPDECKYVIDVRANELYTLPEIHDLLQSQVSSTLTPRSFRLKPSHIDVHHPIVIKGKELGLSSYGSPTLSDQSLLSCTSIKIGPGQSSRSHTADEYILVEEIRNAIRIYVELLGGLNL